MKRRLLVSAAACGVLGNGVRAQSRTRLPTIGILSLGVVAKRFVDSFRMRLGELGYLDGRDARIEILEAGGRPERLLELARHCVALPVDVIVAEAVQAARAARDATTRIPIVMMHAANPAGAGLIDSLARPGGNVTGTVSLTPETAPKLIELVQELNPKARRAAVLLNPNNPASRQWLDNAAGAAQRVGLETVPVAANKEEDLVASFTAIERSGRDSLVVLAEPLLALHRGRIIDFAKARRLTDVYAITQMAREGGLAGYSPVFTDHWVRGAEIVVKILRGAQPSDIPVEQPTRFELVINLGRARALDLAIPATLLARADEVIE